MNSHTPPARGLPDLGRTDAYDYDLPPGRIARYPAERRDASRLLVVPRGGVEAGTAGAESGAIPEVGEAGIEAVGAVGEVGEAGRAAALPGAGAVDGAAPFRDLHFADLPDLFAPGDLVALNESRVLPLRLLGRGSAGAEREVLLLRPAPGEGDELGTHRQGAHRWGAHRWEALVRPGGKLRPGRSLEIAPDLRVVIEEALPDGGRIVRLETPSPVEEVLERVGHIPLPPYLERADEPLDRERYQTVYARDPGSVAAPTAGLHFTEELLAAIEARGVGIARVTLHVGPGTFRPVEAEAIGDHRMHAERWQIPPAAAEAIQATRAMGGRIWAVGTTVVRTLESAVGDDGTLATSGETRLFISPGFQFRVVDALITNFHLPRSTLLMLVSAFAGYRTTMVAYTHAIAEGYRFYSYGDAMVITPGEAPSGGEVR